MAAILLVEDDLDTRRVLGRSLLRGGYDCSVFESGEAALAAFEPGKFDAAVLDVHLPGIDGVELASRIKQQTPHEYFPVMLIGGVDIVEERVRGLSAGCDDFMGKPLSMVELHARLASLLARRAQHAELARANAMLVDLQQKRRELASLVVHDLRNPLSAILGNIELLKEEIEHPTEIMDRILLDLHELAIKVLSMVGGLLDVEDLEEGLLVADPSEVELEDFVHQIARHHTARLRARQLTIEFDVNAPAIGRFDRQLIGRVVENLLDNSVRYAPRRGRVVVRVTQEEGSIVIRVGNDGPAVPLPERQRIFDRYHRLEERRAGARANRGLGLYFCKLAAEAHSGTIAVEELSDLPACFTVRLPQRTIAAAMRARRIPRRTGEATWPARHRARLAPIAGGGARAGCPGARLDETADCPGPAGARSGRRSSPCRPG
jgi:signal transduction histidine kinase